MVLRLNNLVFELTQDFPTGGRQKLEITNVPVSMELHHLNRLVWGSIFQWLYSSFVNPTNVVLP